MFSVIIPVHNNWPLTKTCLDTLAAQSSADIEVIVVDNASTDDTPRACPLRGRRIFGERFTFLRNEVNRNFSGACNQGAAVAARDYLYFLNNDTETLTPWEDTLLGVFAADSCIGGLTPLLTYPPDFLQMTRVQHVGVTFSPERRVSHLYEFFPADHPFVHRPRRFQAVTAAALAVPRGLFFSAGGFDEGFVNGFEDVELCSRLTRNGWALTVASAARVRHLCGQTAGRSAREAANAARLTALCPDIVPDKAAFVRADGYELRLTSWLTFETQLSPARRRALLPELKHADASRLVSGLAAEPFWLDGYRALARVFERGGLPARALETLHLATQFCATPECLLPLRQLGSKMGVSDCFEGLETALRRFVISPQERLRTLRDLRKRFRGVDEGLCADATALLGAEPQCAALVAELELALTENVYPKDIA